MIVRDFKLSLGVKRRAILCVGSLPDAVLACVGGGSNAMGMFYPFLEDTSVRLVGVEAGGDGVATGRHAAPLNDGVVGVLHGNRTYLMQDEDA